MSHSLRAKIKGLRYKGIITDKDCDRLCKALDNEGVLDKIRAEFQKELDICDDSECDMVWAVAMEFALEVIDKYTAESEDKECISKN